MHCYCIALINLSLDIYLFLSLFVPIFLLLPLPLHLPMLMPLHSYSYPCLYPYPSLYPYPYQYPLPLSLLMPLLLPLPLMHECIFPGLWPNRSEKWSVFGTICNLILNGKNTLKDITSDTFLTVIKILFENVSLHMNISQNNRLSSNNHTIITLIQTHIVIYYCITLSI